MTTTKQIKKCICSDEIRCMAHGGLLAMKTRQISREKKVKR